MQLTSRFNQALTYASEAHAHQKRKGTDTPYVSHLLIVAGTALEFGADEDEAIAALLHDAVEDAGGKEREDDIRLRFGARVAAIVRACSDTDVVPKPPAWERKLRYLEHLRKETDRSVLLVSACDKLANARAILQDFLEIGDEVFKRFNMPKERVIEYYRRLAEIYRGKTNKGLAEAVDRTVSELVRLTSAP